MIFAPAGTLSIDLVKRQYVPGDTIKGRVKLHLDKPVKARRFVISLIGEEWVNISCGSGKSRRIKKEEKKIHTEEIELSGEGTYDIAEKDFQFRIPQDAPPTINMRSRDPARGPVDMNGEGAGLRWIMHAKLDVPLGMDKNAIEELFIF